ncbi:MAG TPA: hypothetical protein VGE01_04740 [Fimbriimonas sp.]
MREENYASSSEVVRNLADLRTAYEVIGTEGKFRIIRFSPPYFDGYEFWVVNEKGFLWEPADRLEDAEAYLKTDEAREYNDAG